MDLKELLHRLDQLTSRPDSAPKEKGKKVRPGLTGTGGARGAADTIAKYNSDSRDRFSEVDEALGIKRARPQY